MERLQTGNELFQKAKENLQSLTDVEKYMLGLASLTTFLDPQIESLLGSEFVGKRLEVIKVSVTLLISGLQEIRTDENISEAQKLHSGLLVFSLIENFETLPDEEMRTKLFAETWLNIAAGLQTRIGERAAELDQQWQESMLRLAATLNLRKNGGTLTPVGQVENLATNLAKVEALDDKGRKQILLAWIRGIIEDGASEPEVAEIVQFFFDREDDVSANETTIAFLKHEPGADK